MSEFAQPRKVQRNDTRMSPTSLAVLQYVKTNHAATSFDALVSLFCQDNSNKNTMEAFRARLGYLVHAGHLVRTECRGEYRYTLGDSVPLPRKSNAEVNLTAYQADATGQRTPAPSYDRMHGPAYVPPADHCPRTGGLDYKRHASVGYQC